MGYDKSTPAAKNTSKSNNLGSITDFLEHQFLNTYINMTPQKTQTCLRSDTYLLKQDISYSTGTNIYLNTIGLNKHDLIRCYKI